MQPLIQPTKNSHGVTNQPATAIDTATRYLTGNVHPSVGSIRLNAKTTRNGTDTSSALPAQYPKSRRRMNEWGDIGGFAYSSRTMTTHCNAQSTTASKSARANGCAAVRVKTAANRRRDSPVGTKRAKFHMRALPCRVSNSLPTIFVVAKHIAFPRTPTAPA